MTLFRRIHAETGVTIVLVTHTKQLVAYGTRHIAMAGGEIAWAHPRIPALSHSAQGLDAVATAAPTAPPSG